MKFATDRRLSFSVALLTAMLLAGCSERAVVLTPGPTPTPTATPTGSPTLQTVTYTAIGASDAVGYGASVPCANPPLVSTPTCPGGTGYVPLIAAALAKTANVTLLDLGISGAVIGPDILALGNQYASQGSAAPCQPRTGADVIPGDFLTNELPQIKGTETLVTIFAGGNDTNVIVNAAACQAAGGATQAQIATFLTNEITAFGNDFQSLLAQVHTKAPNALIVVANLPNFAGIPFAQAPAVAAAKPLLQTVSVGIDNGVYQQAATASHVPVVDLLCDPRSYDPANFYVDGFHPDDAGYAIFAQAFLAQITATTPTLPKTSCPQMMLAGTAVAPLLAPLPNFNRK